MSEGKRNMPRDGALDKAEAPVRTAEPSQGRVGEVSESRRRFTKAGLLATPVLMSVASRPVLGGGIPCISNMLSGNLSHPQRGQCVLGLSPSDWIDIEPWPTLPPEYPIDKGSAPGNQDLTCANCTPGASGNWKCGGTTFDDIFGDGDTRPMYQILCEDPNLDNPTEKSAFIAAILNSLAYDYVLKPMQVQDLWNGDYIHVLDKTTFLIRTWTPGAWDGTW